MGGEILVVEDVWKSYSGKPVLKGVSLSVKQGSITGLLGPNGSGKTTLLRVSLGIARRDRGRVLLDGRDPLVDPHSRERVGYIPERPELPSSVPIMELLRLTAMLYGCPRPLDCAAEAVAQAGLEGHEHKVFRALSAGLKQRAAIAHALVAEPELIIADEPTANLDPLERSRLLSLLVSLSREQGVTVLYTSHILAEVTRTVDEIIVVYRGRRIFQGTPAGLVESARIVTIRCLDPSGLARFLAERGYEVRAGPFEVRVFLESRSELPRLLELVASISGSNPVYSVDTVESAIETLLEEVSSRAG